MDEPGLAAWAQKYHQSTSSIERRHILFPPTMWKSQGGRWRPLYDTYARSRFILISSPLIQHFIQWLLVASILMMWAFIANHHRMPSSGIVLGLLATHYLGSFTVASISLLSIQELPVLFFLTASILLTDYCRNGSGIIVGILAFLSALIAVLIKETAFSLIPAVLVIGARTEFRKWERALGVVLITIFIAFPIFLMEYVQGDYSSSYEISINILIQRAFETIQNFSWSFKFGVPFLLIGLSIKLFRTNWSRLDMVCLIGIVSYLGILLPWTSSMNYYQGPIGPFLGFLTASAFVAINKEVTRSPYKELILWTSILLFTFMALSPLKNLQKSHQMNEGLLQVQTFLIEKLKDEHVYINGEEAANTIPQNMSLRTNRTFNSFIYASPDIKFQYPCYVINNSGQTRYPTLKLPPEARQVAKFAYWEIFYINVTGIDPV